VVGPNLYAGFDAIDNVASDQPLIAGTVEDLVATSIGA
jgi:hypothetical protein